MGALQEILAKFSIDVDSSKLEKGKKEVGGFKKALAEMGGLVAGGLVVNGIRNMVSEMVDLGSNINDTSARIGISTNDLQEWSYVLGQTGGSAADVEPLFRTLQKNLGEVGGEAGKGSKLISELLGSDYETKGKELGQIASDAADAISKLPEQADKGRIALDLFGKSGMKLLPVFKDGKEGFGAMIEQYEALGGGLSEDAISALDDLGDKTDQLDLALTGLKAQVVVGIAPAITKFTGMMGLLAANFRKGDEHGGHLKNVMIGVGIAGAVAATAILAPWILMIATLGLVGLVVDDLITAFNGGDAASKRLLDKIFGKGAGEDIFSKIKQDVLDLSKAMGEQEGLVNKLAVAFGTVGGSIVKFFADEIPAAIGVATKQMKGADTTWRDLFKDAQTLEAEVTEKRHAGYQEASAAQRKQLLSQADMEVARWEKFEKNLTKDQQLFRRQAFEKSGTVDPADQWRQNQKILKGLVGNDDASASEQAYLSEQKAKVANLRNQLASAGVPVEGAGFATSRVGENYGTRFADDGKGGMVQITANPNTVVNVTINTTDAEAHASIGGEIQKAIRSANEAALNALEPVRS